MSIFYFVRITDGSQIQHMAFTQISEKLIDNNDR